MTRPDPVPRASFVYRFCAAIAFAVFRLQGWRFDVRGAEHLPARGGAVLVANHTSFWDFFVIGRHALQEMGRPVRILAREDLFQKPVFGWFMRRAEHIPVHRTRGAGALGSAVEALRRGELVLVLPEQTISRSFELLAFTSGAARMASMAGVPLVPAVSWGSHRFHTVAHRPRPHLRLPVTVAYGEPLLPAEGENARRLTERLRARMQVMLHEVQDDYPDRPSPGEDAWWLPARLGGAAPTADQTMTEQSQLRRAWREGNQRLGPRDLMRAVEQPDDGPIDG